MQAQLGRQPFPRRQASGWGTAAAHSDVCLGRLSTQSPGAPVLQTLQHKVAHSAQRGHRQLSARPLRQRRQLSPHCAALGLQGRQGLLQQLRWWQAQRHAACGGVVCLQRRGPQRDHQQAARAGRGGGRVAAPAMGGGSGRGEEPAGGRQGWEACTHTPLLLPLRLL